MALLLFVRRSDVHPPLAGQIWSVVLRLFTTTWASRKLPAGAAGAASAMLVAPLVPLLDGSDPDSATAPEAVPVEKRAITTASAAAKCTFRARVVAKGCTGSYSFFTLHLTSWSLLGSADSVRPLYRHTHGSSIGPSY